MKDKIFEIIISEISPATYHASALNGTGIAASKIADMFEKFVGWKDNYVYYVPRYTDTENNRSYLYIWWKGLDIKDRQEKYFTLNELFNFWHDKIYKTEER